MNFIQRIKNLQKFIKDKNVDLLIIEDAISLFYLTGLNLSSAKLLVSCSNSKLFVDGRFIEVAQSFVKQSNNLLEVILINEKAISDDILKNQYKKIAFDSASLSYLNFEKLKTSISKIKEKNHLDIELVPINNPLKEFRVIKDSAEIELLKKAAELNWMGFEHINKLLKEGITEIELAFEFELFIRKKGSQGLSFDTIICFGKNSAMPHHEPSNTKLKLNDLVLIDIGVKYNSYNSDMTRVLFFGNTDPKLQKMYSIVKKAQMAALSICRPKTKLKDLDLAARKVLKEENFEKEFLHSLGHGVGLEIHEFPRIKFDNDDKDVVLESGMVITIEPGIYIPDFGGVRYEDTILITKDGYENFYKS